MLHENIRRLKLKENFPAVSSLRQFSQKQKSCAADSRQEL